MDLKTLSPAFILGVLHALEPGHGRTAIVGYLIGQGGSWLPALALGLANALTHGAAIFFLAYLIQLGLTCLTSGLARGDSQILFQIQASGTSHRSQKTRGHA
jgi:nickel/cobalt exporter